MYRNRSTTDPVSKQSSIAHTLSSIPVMATSKDNDNPSSPQSPTDTQNLLNKSTMNTNREPRRSRTTCQPKGTIPYIVGNSDTLEKIALHFNLTPSELLQLNKLYSRIVFPGQILYVPEVSYSANINNEQEKSNALPIKLPSSLLKIPKDDDVFIVHNDRRTLSESSPPVIQQDIGQMVWSMSRQIISKPGRAQRLESDQSIENELLTRPIEDRIKTQKEDNKKQVRQIKKSLSIEESQQLDEECLRRFIKLNVRLMTDDHKSVAGTLLVTPNAVMFDPDVLDPLVKENGIDKYGLIIRMDLLAGIALYEDIAMYEHAATLRDEEKRKMCHSTSLKNFHQSTTILSNNDEHEIHEIMSSLLDHIDKELNLSTDLGVMLYNVSSNIQRRISSDNQSFHHEDLFHSFDDSKHSIGVLIDDKDLSSEIFNWTRLIQVIVLKKCNLENCVPADEFNKRFGEIDKLLQKQHDIYVTPHPIEIPYYLCLKTSTPTNDIGSVQDRLNRKSIDYVYGKKQLDHEYWFSVPKEKIDHIYAFFLRWSPDHSTDLLSHDNHFDNNNTTTFNQIHRRSSYTQIKQNEISSGQGFVLLANDDPELTDDYLYTNQKNNTINSKNSISIDNDIQQKKQHYLKRQNTLLKEWEFIILEGYST
ncbi:unnamed protein product [Rotaria sordida]|uniref:LysM domain-containing protein n=1 Tax=Rotaria sordida TaxID=392033 RepID=A0A819KI08_9BILA|nr:unnamed protein product [Rotaria sordida]CAF3946402.1 unnamed protein product [Rotaria sordida]